jgi:hypothetical protein
MVRGKSVGGVRARWVVLVLIIGLYKIVFYFCVLTSCLGGIILRIVFDAAANINELAVESYVPFVTTRAFLNFWKENFTQAIPLAFHLLLVADKSADSQKYINSCLIPLSFANYF